MKIEASKRLEALELRQDSYPDKDGLERLAKFGSRPNIKVKTNIRGMTLAVESNQSFGLRKIAVFVLVEGEPVGIVDFTQTWFKMFTPSSYFKQDYRGKGYAKTVYRWVLNSTVGLVSDKIQSQYSRNLWTSLAKEYPVLLVLPKQDKILFEGQEALDNAETPYSELVLLGKGTTVEQFKRDFDFD